MLLPIFSLFTAWTIEVVTSGLASPTFFIRPIITLDSLARPYILTWQKRTAQTNFLFLFSKEDGSWAADTFELNQSSVNATSIDMTMDPYCRIWSAYTIHDPGALIVAHKIGFSWEKDTLDTFPALWASIISDSRAIPHIVYQAGNLVYAYLDGSVWQKKVVDSSIYTESGCAINLDSGGQPQISYFRIGSIMGDKLWYAYEVQDQWYLEAVDNPDVPNRDPTSIQLNANTLPCIVYSPSGRLSYAYKKGGAWYCESIGEGQIATHKSLVIDSLNKPYILYYYGNTILAHKDATGWSDEVLPSTPTATRGYGGSLQIDRNGIFHIARFAQNYAGTYYEIHYIYGRPEGIKEETKAQNLKAENTKLEVLPNVLIKNAILRYNISKKQKISLRLYDVIGRKVTTITEGFVEPGVYTHNFNPANLSSGIYFLILETQKETRTQKILIVK